MAYRSIIGEYKKFWDDEPFAFGKMTFELDISDYDANAIYPANEVKRDIILDQNGTPPLGFSLWANEDSAKRSKYKITDPDGTQWTVVIPPGATAIKIQDLRAMAM